MPDKMPLKLMREPIVDAICEFRLNASLPLHTVLPGIFYAQLGNIAGIESLPSAAIPADVRRANPGLADLPAVRLLWGRYFLLIGDRTLSVAVKLPYPGWASFKQDVMRVANVVLAANVATHIERYSIKYINLIEIAGTAAQTAALNWSVQAGPFQLLDRTAHVRLEGWAPPFTTVLNLATGANVQLVTGVSKTGVLVDVDTVCQDQVDTASFGAELNERLEAIRQYNKRVFFDCLTTTTIDSLEPMYALQ